MYILLIKCVEVFPVFYVYFLLNYFTSKHETNSNEEVVKELISGS